MSDALDRLGVAGQCRGIGALHKASRFAGPAVTLLMAPSGTAGGSVGDYVDDVPAGAVIVIDNQGRLDATVWGDLMTTTAHQRGIAGTVIDGVCRDVARSVELGYSLFSRGRYMRTGKDRVRLDGLNVSVSLAEVRVEPGALVVGDADGVVVVPESHETDVLAAALEIHEAEERIRDAVKDGTRLDEARRRFGYFALQRRST